MPVKVLAGRQSRVIGQEQSLKKRRPSIILTGHGISANGISQGLGDVNLQRWADGKEPRVKGHIVTGAGGQPVPEIQALAGCAVLHGLICPAISMRLAPKAKGFQPAKHAPLAAVAEHVQGEHMLPDPGRGQDDLLCLLLRPDAFAGPPRDLLLEGILQNRGLELVLAEAVELAAVLKAEEIGTTAFTYALGAGRSQQRAIDMSETGGVAGEASPRADVSVRAPQDGQDRRPGVAANPPKPTCFLADARHAI